MERREFLKLAGSALLCACALGSGGCAGGGSRTPDAPEGSYRREGSTVVVSLPAVEALRATGGAVRLALGETRVLVVHLAGEDYRAFADRCTHNDRALDYLQEEGQICCRSRKSRFDPAGRLIEGPAESGLLAYPLRREGENLVIEA
jgi:nitrite reductase/ring-hydroxylating ferredoxin subunit